MTRYDLRHLKDKFELRMGEILDELSSDEVAIFLFEQGDFANVKKSADLANSKNCEVLNSLKFNEVDWTLVVKKGL